MCNELHTRYRRCTHTRLLHWTYSPILTPSERQPSTGRSCRKYKLRYKESFDSAACFECKVSEIAGWGAVLRSPTFSNFSEQSPTMSSFLDYEVQSPTVSSFGVRSPTFATFKRLPTFSTFASSAGLLEIGAGNRVRKDSDVSVVASGTPLSPVASDWPASGDSKEGQEKEPAEEAKEGGVKGWFRKRFKAREGYDSEVFGFQRMDA